MVVTKGKLTLYRGIAVADENAEPVRKAILERGLLGDEGSWKFVLRDLRPRLEAIFESPSKFREIEPSAGPEFKMFNACGDVEGATYYACKHNRTEKKTSRKFEPQNRTGGTVARWAARTGEP